MTVAGRTLLVLAAILVRASSAAGAAYLKYGDATIAAGEAGQISVVLRTEGTEIAGVQNEIALPPALHLIADGGACYANPAIGKNGTAFRMLWHTTGSERLRAVVISLTDIDAIPDGSVLYTCDVEVAADAPPGTYRVRAVNLLASDPYAVEVLLGGVDGLVTVAGRAPRATIPSVTDAPGAEHGEGERVTSGPRASTPRPSSQPARRSASTPVPTPTATPAASAPSGELAADLPARGAAGCQIASDSYQSSLFDFVALVTLIAVGVVRRGRQRRHTWIRLSTQQ